MEKALFFSQTVGYMVTADKNGLLMSLNVSPTDFTKQETVAAALTDLAWVSNIKGALSWLGLIEYLELWDAVSGFVLSPAEDIYHWKLNSSGIFSTKSAYRSFFFFGSITT